MHGRWPRDGSLRGPTDEYPGGVIPPVFDRLPRRDLLDGPTPLTLAPRFSEALGVEVWIKRDDVGQPAFAGNKIRKLEYLVGEALAAGADTLVTTGAAQSNSARAAAAAAVASGLRAVLVLGGDPPEVPTGNLVVDQLVGAEIRFVGDVGWDALDRTVEEIADELRGRGGRPVTAPVGCSSPLGTLGFARAWFELSDQAAAQGIEPSAVYHASTSGGTHAGLVLGRAMAGRGPVVRGISAGLVQEDPEAHHRELAIAAGSLLDADVGDVEVTLDRSQIGGGYGMPTEACVEAIRLLARTEAILCDPVYSGKGLAGLVADARAGRVEGPVVFWHTGGYHALFDPPTAAPVLDAG